jgi:hypothetical protein
MAAFFVLQRVVQQIHIDPQALSRVMSEAVVLTLEQGTTEQKIELLNQLASLGPAAGQFREAVQNSTEDKDPRVQAAARRGLAAIAPEPPKKL